MSAEPDAKSVSGVVTFVGFKLLICKVLNLVVGDLTYIRRLNPTHPQNSKHAQHSNKRTVLHQQNYFLALSLIPFSTIFTHRIL